jgi:hypothetical protein
MDWQASLSIDTVSGLDHVVLNVATNSVLRTKQRFQLNAIMLMQQIRSVVKPVIDRCLIADQSNARTANPRTVFK